MTIQFVKLTKPTSNVVKTMNHWENDPALIPLIRPNRNQSELERQVQLTDEDVKNRLMSHHIYLIYLNDQLIGEMNYMVNPPHLYKKDPRTAWIAIVIGEIDGRGKGIGTAAIQYLEKEIKKYGLKRIELGVFEFNKQAHKLYKKLGYKEIGRIDRFTYWQGKMWSDIRMEKYL